MEEMLLKEMGQRLSARRKQLRLTQEEVAERADMTTQTISTAENGIKALRPENIIKLCGALKISADYLLFGTISSDDQGCLDLQSEDKPHQFLIRRRCLPFSTFPGNSAKME